MEIADGSVAASKIVFSSLLDRLAHDHPTLYLSSYTLEDVLGVPTLRMPPLVILLLVLLNSQSPEALPASLKDRPLEVADVEAKRDWRPLERSLTRCLLSMMYLALVCFMP